MERNGNTLWGAISAIIIWILTDGFGIAVPAVIASSITVVVMHVVNRLGAARAAEAVVVQETGATATTKADGEMPGSA